MDDQQQVKTRKKKGERKDRRIQVTLTVGVKPDGSPDRKSFYGKTRTEANRKRDEYKAKMAVGIIDSKITVADWVDTCLRLYRTNVNPAYSKGDAVPYNRLKAALGKKQVSEVREADLQALINKLDGTSSSNIKKYYQAFFRVFEKARTNRLIFINPAEGLDLPEGTKGTHRSLERWETDCILKNWNQHRCGLWAMLMLLCGLRRGEMMALRWENIDMEKKQLRVREVAVIASNKSKIEERAKSISGLRVLPICGPLWEALNTVPADKRIGLVCVSAKGEQISGSAYDRGWDGFNLAMQRILNGEPVVQQGRRETLETKIAKAEKEGRQYIIFDTLAHDLRHTFATALYDADVPVKAAQYYLGHADVRMTLDLYTHLSQEREKTSRSQIVDFLDGWLDNSVTVEDTKKDHQTP